MNNFFFLIFQDPRRTFSYDDLLGLRPWLPDTTPPMGVQPELDGLKEIGVDRKYGHLTFFNKQSAQIVLSEYEESRRHFGGHELWLFTHDATGETLYADKLVNGKLVRVRQSLHYVD